MNGKREIIPVEPLKVHGNTVIDVTGEKSPVTSLTERELLDQCEYTIEKGKHAFIEVCQALFTIRENQLYKLDGFTSFEIYCQTKWDFSRQYASKLIQAANVENELSTTVDTPNHEPFLKNENQSRRWLALTKDEQNRIKTTLKEGNGFEKELKHSEILLGIRKPDEPKPKKDPKEKLQTLLNDLSKLCDAITEKKWLYYQLQPIVNRYEALGRGVDASADPFDLHRFVRLYCVDGLIEDARWRVNDKKLSVTEQTGNAALAVNVSSKTECDLPVSVVINNSKQVTKKSTALAGNSIVSFEDPNLIFTDAHENRLQIGCGKFVGLRKSITRFNEPTYEYEAEWSANELWQYVKEIKANNFSAYCFPFATNFHFRSREIKKVLGVCRSEFDKCYFRISNAGLAKLSVQDQSIKAEYYFLRTASSDE